MQVGAIIYIGAVLLAYALISKRLASSPISGPLFFTTLGLIGYAAGFLPPIIVIESPVRLVLALTRALLLFTDASQVVTRKVGAPSEIIARVPNNIAKKKAYSLSRLDRQKAKLGLIDLPPKNKRKRRQKPGKTQRPAAPDA